MTSAAQAPRRRVRPPQSNCRGPAALANQAGVTEDGPRPPAELVPSLPGPSHVHPHRPCPGRALSIGRDRKEHTSELQSHSDLVCRLLLEKKKKYLKRIYKIIQKISFT